MNFLYPQFLYGLVMLSVPVIIHLFNFRKTKKVYFSNSRFLQQVKDSKSARQRLKHLLIMLSRLLFILFLVLAFAQPYIPSKELQQQEMVHIYLDNSLSMSNLVAEDLSAFDQGIQKVEKILHLYPPEARFKLLTNDFSSPLRVFRSKDEILDMLTEVKPTGVQRSFEDIWKRFNHQSSSQKADWYFISDFQKATLSDIEGFSADSTQQYIMVPQVFERTANVFIDSVYLKNPFLIANTQNSIEIRLRNTGSEPVRDLVITLAIDGKQVANAGVDIPAQGQASTEINLNFPLEGINPARLTFEEFPVSFDNDFYFNLDLSQKISVLEIKNTNDLTPVAKVYGNQELFNFQSYHIDNLDYTTVEQVDLVILNSVNPPPSLRERLANKINERGGHLLIVPGSFPQVATLQRLTPFSGVVVQQDSVWVTLEAPSVQHPFFQDTFEDQQADLVTMPKVRNTVRWSSQQGDNLLVGKNGVPYLSVDYRGQVYLFGSPFQPEFSSLSQHAIFVPVMYKIAALSKAYDRKLYHTTDEQLIKITPDSISGTELFTMSNGEAEIVPDQRVVGKDLFLEVPPVVIKPGFYYLNAPYGPIELISYNNNQLESILEQYSVNELSQLFDQENVSILDDDQFDRFSDRILQAKTGIPMWKYAVLLALMCLVAEVLLIRFLK